MAVAVIFMINCYCAVITLSSKNNTLQELYVKILYCVSIQYTLKITLGVAIGSLGKKFIIICLAAPNVYSSELRVSYSYFLKWLVALT